MTEVFKLGSLSINQSTGLGSKNVAQKVEVNVLPPEKEFTKLCEIPDLGIVFDHFGLRNVVELCFDTFSNIKPKKGKIDTTEIPLDEKHELNNLNPIFWDETIALKYEYQFGEFDDFLELRENSDLLGKLEDIAASLNMNVLSQHTKNQDKEFQVIIQSIGNTLIENNYDALSGKSKTISLVLYYLYSKCLLGRKTKAEKLNAYSQ